MLTHEQLVALIAARKGRGLKFGHGIWTADKYVQTLAECIGPGMCQRYFGSEQKSLGALIKEASQKLTFAGPDLEIEEKLATGAATIKQLLGGLELPEHTMMAFTHVLTTPREDRDGDVLLTEGAQPDEKMPMLWQHVHTLPIGKAIKVIEHSAERLKMASVLLDINELTHDAGILLEAKALRFSHGFRALDFAERQKAGGMGFEVKSFEIMEESLVSVPSNVEAEIELLGKRKLKSEVFKAHAEFLRRNMRQKKVSLPGVTMKFGSFEDLKKAADAGVISTLAKDSQVTVEAGGRRDAGDAGSGQAGHDHKQPCGCQGKSTGKSADKAPGEMPRDRFSNQTDAESRSEVLGCDGHHVVMGANGASVFMPCRNPQEYSMYAQGGTAPMLPVGRADAKPSAEKVWMDGSSLSGSYLHRMTDLQTDAQRFLMGAGMDVDVDDCISIFALFDGYGILCVMEGFRAYEWNQSSSGEETYYRATWSEEGGEAKWTGVPTEVQVEANLNISATAERQVAMVLKAQADGALEKLVLAEPNMELKPNKVGRVISTANLQKLNDALDDLKRLQSLDVPREASALVDRVVRIVGDVVSAAGNGEDQQPKQTQVTGKEITPKEITAKEAAAIVLQSSDVVTQRKLANALRGILEVYQGDAKAAELNKLLRR